MKNALCVVAAGLTLALAAPSPARGQAFALPSPTTTQFGPPIQPAPNTSSGTLTGPTTGSFAATATTSPLQGTTSAFMGAPFNNVGVPFGQPLPVFPYNNVGAPFNAAPGTILPATPAPAPFFPGVTPAPVPKSTSPSTTTPAPPAPRHASLRLLEEANAERRRSLAADFAARHRSLVDSDEWHAACRSERKAKLQALKAEFREKERRLREAYYRKRAQLLLQAAD